MEIEALRERVSRLSAAVLRASASLDLDTVLQEVVDSARALTGARFGVIVTVDGTGQAEEWVMSGFAPVEQDELVAWAYGPQLFEHLRSLAAPIRVGDLPAFVRALGFSDEVMPSKTMLGTPLRHRDMNVGNFFLGEKEGGREFTDADEEVLTLFAAQAATAIANARAHREERRARADLETLIETSPVGVVVFDGPAFAIPCGSVVTIEVTGFGRRFPAVRFPPTEFQPRALRRLRIACLSWASSGC
ncbi:MAG: GAF domain-containing protein [Gammaproteobacteria bacterium]|nr:GAF domain-containing protein [Gammaproteobacteria bacterium]